jgi:hypothetical protein
MFSSFYVHNRGHSVNESFLPNDPELELVSETPQLLLLAFILPSIPNFSHSDPFLQLLLQLDVTGLALSDGGLNKT